MEKRNAREPASEMKETRGSFMTTFSSQEEADLNRLKRDISRSDIEKLRMFCKMIRIGKMLSNNNADFKDRMDEEMLGFWRILHKHKVQYILIGGFAMKVQGFPAAGTDYIELWLKDHAENRRHLRKAVRELGYGDHSVLETVTFNFGLTQFDRGTGLCFNIRTEMKGLDSQSFDECLANALVVDFNGTQVPFLHINELITNKKARFSLRDQLELQELEEIRSTGKAFKQIKTT